MELILESGMVAIPHADKMDGVINVSMESMCLKYDILSAEAAAAIG